MVVHPRRARRGCPPGSPHGGAGPGISSGARIPQPARTCCGVASLLTDPGRGRRAPRCAGSSAGNRPHDCVDGAAARSARLAIYGGGADAHIGESVRTRFDRARATFEGVLAQTRRPTRVVILDARRGATRVRRRRSAVQTTGRTAHNPRRCHITERRGRDSNPRRRNLPRNGFRESRMVVNPPAVIGRMGLRAARGVGNGVGRRPARQRGSSGVVALSARGASGLDGGVSATRRCGGGSGDRRRTDGRSPS